MTARAFATNAFKIGVITAAVGMFFPSCSLLWSRQQANPVAQTILPRNQAPAAPSNPPGPAATHTAGDRPLAQGDTTTPTPGGPKPSEGTIPIQGKISYPVAKTVPGRDGFVFSPFDQQRVIDVTEFKSGALVADPTFPLSDKKFFRVP
ncbi:hypothetical protein [Haloferula sp. BvORR071]|uniref:hypothetical protein n=1 Tax=Haloferula sp. BvORR071 TaxID=1396141 RepID=UPI00054E3133|nr:hypothetical protein [Haloferula sp. BvORR071]